MDQRPIGVFDSGLGGLTAVRALTERLPSENIVYFGDTARVPYGTRSPDTILRYAEQDIRFLKKFDVKALVVACGTVSAVALPKIANDYPFPILGVVAPAVNAAARATANGKIGLLGTSATVKSGAYEREIKALLPSAEVFSTACPLFVPLVENGRVRKDDLVLMTVIEEYLTPIKAAGVDTLILGCTHYPIIADAIAAFMGDEVTLVNPSAEAVSSLASLPNFSENTQGGTLRFYVSDDPVGFSKNAELFLGHSVGDAVAQISLEETLR
ncbi:MAG: glutamate racemase [Ruminococcaceae bacterium]|nr:glutamate racemase [Oscillospiraceae bacterium]